jgi:hypothetical protein
MLGVAAELITVPETSIFVRQAEAIWDDDQRLEFVTFIAANPSAGDVLPGTGGVRKVRWSRPGSGKRGGVLIHLFLLRRQQTSLPADGLHQGAQGGLESGGEAERSGANCSSQGQTKVRLP